MKRLARRLAPAAALLALAAPAPALVVQGPESGRSELAPPDDPGWAHVGRSGKISAIYLGEGWVLTARHAPIGPVEFAGRRYPPVPDAAVWLDDPGDGGRKADLLLYRLEPAPPLPALLLARETPPAGALAIPIGFGQGRGEDAGPLGYRWDRRTVKRWGTNEILKGHVEVEGPHRTLTRCFSWDWSRLGTPHEAQASQGDSGGAVFVQDSAGSWRLAGVMLSISVFPEQAPETALYDNMTHAADLSLYLPQILRVLAGEERGGPLEKAPPGPPSPPAPPAPPEGAAAP